MNVTNFGAKTGDYVVENRRFMNIYLASLLICTKLPGLIC